MAAKVRPPVKTFKIGYTQGMSNKIHEVYIRGITAFTEIGEMSDKGTWGIEDECECVVFAIPIDSLVYCYVEAAKSRKKKPILVSQKIIPLRAVSRG